MREWHDILETDRERSCHGMWVGFSTDHLLDLVVVLKNEAALDPQCIRKT